MIKPIFDAWIIGDALLRELWLMFAAQKSKAVLDQVSKPYLFEHFNVTPFYPSAGSNTRSTLAQILNEFALALNNLKNLPHYIIFITGLNIVEAAKHGGPGGKLVLERCIQWLFTNINLALTTRKEDLKGHSVGATFVMDNFPHLLWIPAIK